MTTRFVPTDRIAFYAIGERNGICMGLQLTTVTRTQGNNEALKNGTVVPHGVEFNFVEIPVLVDGFRRMVRTLEFDVSEMAITTYLCAKEHGVAFTALPIFLVRGFHHGAMARNTDVGITQPKDLEGRKVGVNRGYTVTTGVWARAILQDEYDVDLGKVTWAPSGDEHVEQYRPPHNVIPLEKGSDLAELLSRGELPAVVGAEFDGPHIAPLIDDPTHAAHESLRKRGFYPINHLIVVKDELLAAHPEIGADIFDAFSRSKERYVEGLRGDPTGTGDSTDQMYSDVMSITGADPLPYGFEPNRSMIEVLIDHAVSQRILTRRPDAEDLFFDVEAG